MWESVDNLVNSVDMDIVPLGSIKSVKHLDKVAETLIRNGLPMGIVLPIFSKRKRLASEINDTCPSCGLDFKLAKSFTLNILTSNNRRIIKLSCKGCGKKFTCGVAPNIITQKGNGDISTLNYADLSTNSTIMNTSVSILATPRSAINTPRVTSLQNSKKNTKKRRGSALQRLLQEEETESDRSLSAFLNSFASQ